MSPNRGRVCDNFINVTTSYIQLVNFLKGQCHDIFDHFFVLDTTWALYEQAKNGFAKFFVFAKIFDRQVQKLGVGIDVDYAGT